VIVLAQPLFDQHLRFPHACEHLPVQELVPEFPVERLVAAVLPRTPRLYEEWMQDYMPAAKPVGKLNRRVLPEFVTVMDEPGLTDMGHLVGPGMYYRTAVVTANILVEEMEFKARSGSEPSMVGTRLKSRPTACIMAPRAVFLCNLSAP